MNTDHTAETVILQPAPSAAELLAMLETAYQQAFFFTNWETRVRNALHNALGDTHPAHLSPDELTRFKDCVYRLVKNTGSIREPDAWIADHRARLEAAANEDGGPINKGLTFDGLLFSTLFDMNRYIVTSVRDRPQWLKNNLGYWRRIEDVLQEIASRQPPGQSKVDLGEPAGTNDQKSPGIQHHNDDKDDAAVVHTPAGDCPPSDGPTSAPPLAPATGEDGTTKSEATPLDPTMSEATVPAGQIASRARPDAKRAPSAPAKHGSSADLGDVVLHRKSAEREPAAPENSAATIPAELPPRAAFGTTLADVLSRAKAAIEAGESLRVIAERLACAYEDFHASQRKIGRAIGWSAGKVSRVLKWHRSGYREASPFGPTTRAGRASRRKHRNGSVGGRGAKPLND
jgi:hypothetical protein